MHFRRFILPFSRQSPPGLVTFDALHTLLELKGPSTALVYCGLIKKKFNVDVNPVLLEPAYKQSWINLKAEIPCYGIELGYKIDEWWYKFVEKSLETSVALPAQRHEMAVYLVSELRKPEYWHLLDGSLDVIRRLSEAGVEMGIVSNCDDRLPSLLDQFSIHKYFNFVYTPVNMKIEKPDPEIFERVLDGRDFLLDGGNFGVHVGDELMEDYIAPRQVGLKSILLTTNVRHSWIRDKVTSMRDLAQCLFDS
uniref:Haloacid dehalogenase-like hydrolase domain-containing protein 3 n=1 Tax=Fundulus heteroclitus TaxID=8078 RepID=A0A146UFF2_FUNHE